MRYKVHASVFHLWLVVTFFVVCYGEDNFNEFDDREEETQVHCVHDSAPRFGKRICDCGYRNEAFIAPKFEGSTTEIEIANCKSLRIRRDSFSELFQLVKLSIINVEDLILEPNAFDFSRNTPSAQLKINLINNVIEQVPSHVLKGPVAEISFTRCRVGVFKPYSITNIRELYALSIVESLVNRIERHAFKRFDVNQLTMNGSKFIAPIPSQSFYEIEVLDRLLITNCSFYALLPSALTFKNVTSLVIRNSEFNDAAGEFLAMQIRKNIQIVGNYFAKIADTGFQGINLDSSYYNRNSERPTMQFHSNRIGRINGARTLRFSNDFDLNLRAIYIEQNINCDQLDALKQSSSILVNHPSEIYFGTSNENSNFKSFLDIQRFQCAEDDFWFYLIIGSVAGAIVLVIITLLISWYCVAQKKKEKRKLNVVMPEPRTYRETQIVMQIENHGLLKTDL